MYIQTEIIFKSLLWGLRQRDGISLAGYAKKILGRWHDELNASGWAPAPRLGTS